jgi:uncharacterized repeat protein (TIGR04138 family)
MVSYLRNVLKRAMLSRGKSVESNDLISELDRIVEGDGRYKPAAYLFVIDAVEFTMLRQGRRGHVTGRELLDGIKHLAKREFGPMARAVFESWGVTTTTDFGEIVFNLVDEGILGKTETDSREDFRDVYDFTEVFDKQYDWNARGVL